MSVRFPRGRRTTPVLFVIALALSLGLVVPGITSAPAAGSTTRTITKTVSSSTTTTSSARQARTMRMAAQSVSGTKITLTAPQARVSGGTVDFAYTVSVSKPTTFRYLQVAIRPVDGTLNRDAGHQPGVAVSGKRSFTARQTLSSGAWRAYVAYSLDGTSWTHGPVTTVTVAQAPVTVPSVAPSVSPSPAPSPSVSPSPAPSPSPSPTSTPTVSPSPAPSQGTRTPAGVSQLGYFYRPPVGVSMDTLAATHGRYILTRLDEPTRDALKARGTTTPFLQYIRFEAIMDNTGLNYTWQNQVAFKQDDWANISRNHPDWFLLDANGKRMRAGDGDASETSFYLMDPANPGWRNFFVTRMREMQLEGRWDGVFLDNVELSLAKRQRTGQVPAKYPTDASYQKAVLDFVTFLRASYFTPEKKVVEANLIEQRTGNDPLWHQNLAAMDGAMREGWAIGWDDSRLIDVWSWERELEQAEQSQRAGKHVWLVAIGSKDNHRRQTFAYASYLLVASGNASFRYASASAYDQPWLYSNYARDLGAPLGPRYKVGNVWKRDFVGGSVSVDPATGAATIA